MKRAVRTRKTKIAEEVAKPTPKERFMKGEEDIERMRQQAVTKFVPATENQKKAVALLRSGVKVFANDLWPYDICRQRLEFCR